MSVLILDAAQQVFETYGARRANLEDVARAAGISKSTLYRAYKTKDELLDAVLARELLDFFTQLDEVASGLPPREAIVECFTRGLALTREIPLLGKLFEAEPETIARADAERSHNALLLRSTEQAVSTLRRAGATMPDHELVVVTELMLRVAYTYMISPNGHLDMADEDVAREFARTYLAPLVC
ncbi:MAG: helix-turn-helix domain-containing protein [Nocardioidaceae bacterium]